MIVRKREEGGPAEDDFLAVQEQRRNSRARIRMPTIDNVVAKKNKLSKST